MPTQLYNKYVFFSQVVFFCPPPHPIAKLQAEDEDGQGAAGSWSALRAIENSLVGLIWGYGDL